MIRGGVYSDFHPCRCSVVPVLLDELARRNAFLLRLPFIMFGLWFNLVDLPIGKLMVSCRGRFIMAAMFSVLEYSIIYSVGATLRTGFVLLLIVDLVLDQSV